MKEVLCMIGNGFNQFMNTYCNSPQYQQDILRKLHEAMPEQESIIAQWLEDTKLVLNRYCHLLDDITLSDYDDTGEFLLSKLAKFCEVIEDSSILDRIESAVSAKTKKEMLQLTYGNPHTNIPKTIRTLCNLTERSESLADALYSFLWHQGYNQIHFVTTNYDMIIDEVFQPDKETRMEIDFIPIHGTYQLDEVICSVPDKKEEKVDFSDMQAFRSYVKDAHTIILFGIGLVSDPHLLACLNTMVNKTVLIIDGNKATYFKKRNYLSNPIKNKIGFDFLYHNHIYFLDTCAFTTDHTRVQPPISSPEQLLDALIYTLKQIAKEPVIG